MYNDKHTKSQKSYNKPLVKMTITEKNNRNYKEIWANIGFNSPCPDDCEYEHPITGKCMSHYDYQVWLNRNRNNKS